MNKAQLAKSLNISRTMLYKLIVRGMPTNRLEAAIKWRKQNLDVARTKRWRIDGNPGIHTNDIEEAAKKPISNLIQQVSNSILNWT